MLKSLVVFGLIAGPAYAGDMPTVSAAMSKADGTEVSGVGAIGSRSVGKQWFIIADGETYPATLAIDRATLASLEDCIAEPFGPPVSCDVSFSAEIAVEGSEIRLIVFKLNRL